MASPPPHSQEGDQNPRIEDEEPEKAEAGGPPYEDEEDEDENEDAEEEEEEEDEEEEQRGQLGRGRASRASSERERMKELMRRISSGPVSLRVHDVLIKGNTKTKESLIEAEVAGVFDSVSSMQELLQAAGVANAKLEQLDIFDSVNITLDAGPPELPNTANVIINVVEAKSPLSGDIGAFSRPGDARSWTLELSLKLKNMLGYGDIWDASGIYGGNQSSEISTGVSLPRFGAIHTPLTARVSLLTQDWLKFSSYKEQLLGFTVGLISTKHHDLSYHLTWRTLSDPSRMSSKSIRRHLGHSMLSSLQYTFKIDERDSHLRPTRGYAIVSSSQIGGIGSCKFLRFVRQELDLRAAFPLGFYNMAFNYGVAAGILLPWGGFMNLSSPVSDRFYIGGQSSVVCGLGGPISLLGFKSRGLGPTDSRRLIPSKSEKDDSNSSPGRDVLGGDLAVTAFADLSFDLPLRLFRQSGIHGHTFICAGNLTKLTENEYKRFSLRNFFTSFRSSLGVGIVIPTKIFRMEINYCYILKQFEHDRGKTGIQFSFSSPS